MSDPTRIQYLKDKVNAQEQKRERTHSIQWRNKTLHLPVIRVETSFLKYRLENGRTKRKQIEYLSKNPDVPHDLFSDPESKMAQETQHIILKEMINDMDLKTNLLDEGQRDPAIITYDGYVLNGNRRLAALKEVNEQFMDCVVLPLDSTPKDLYELELDLQMSKETKANYNWVDEILHIDYGIKKLGETKEIVAKKMRRDKKEIQEKMTMLELVNLYLEWMEKKGQYYSVEGDEQAFKELVKFSQKIKDPQKGKFFREGVFAIIQNPSEGRIYDHIRHFYNNLDDVIKKLDPSKDDSNQEFEGTKGNDPKVDDTGVENIKINNIDIKIENNSAVEIDDCDDPLDLLIELDGVNEKETELQRVATMFKTSESAELYAPSLIESIQDSHEEQKEKNDRNASYNAVKAAHNKLQGVTIDSTTQKVIEIKERLAQIIEISNNLLTKIETLSK